MWLLDRMAEEQISRAQQRGEFDDLPGSGRPLQLEEDALVPEELRSAYRLLKNAGCLPPELHLRREISNVESLMNLAQSVEGRAGYSRRLRVLMSRLHQSASGAENLRTQQAYYDQLVRKLERGKD